MTIIDELRAAQDEAFAKGTQVVTFYLPEEDIRKIVSLAEAVVPGYLSDESRDVASIYGVGIRSLEGSYESRTRRAVFRDGTAAPLLPGSFIWDSRDVLPKHVVNQRGLDL